ncbi:MAG: hypothetical protein IKN17_07565 [Ruminococcus sp.]|nr:hypothetical protein [Ruminococcus sp.]
MLTSILIGWILYQLSAPVWCWVLFVIIAAFKTLGFGMKVAEICSKKN